mmetsp:Transcript_40973/g.87283  ORF Transcript_40973/g.87283 Transcript_40973/m.87283 type:complete len:735 (+) Transcript_40973:134-2338(+)
MAKNEETITVRVMELSSGKLLCNAELARFRDVSDLKRAVRRKTSIPEKEQALFLGTVPLTDFEDLASVVSRYVPQQGEEEEEEEDSSVVIKLLKKTASSASGDPADEKENTAFPNGQTKAAPFRGDAPFQGSSTFSIGTFVEVFGLLKAPHLNGSLGVIRGGLDFATDRYDVELAKSGDVLSMKAKNLRPTDLAVPGAQGSTSTKASSSSSSWRQPAVKRDAMEEDAVTEAGYEVGDAVQIHGLESSRLNGKTGIIKGPLDEEKGVYVVELRGSKELHSVKLGNLSASSASTDGKVAEQEKKPGSQENNPFPAGTRVKMVDLQNLPQLDDCIAMVRRFDKEVRKYVIDLGYDARGVKVSPENLEQVNIPLLDAFEAGDLLQVQTLLRDGADPNTRNENGETLLLEAAFAGDLNLMSLLLAHGAEPRISNISRKAKVQILVDIFQTRQAASEEKVALLHSLDLACLAQARKFLRLGGRFPLGVGGKSPSVCISKPQRVLQLKRTATHEVSLHSADALRPVLQFVPLAGAKPSALIIFLHGIFQSAPMLERSVQKLMKSMPHAHLIAPTAPIIEVWGEGPAWFNVWNKNQWMKQLEEARSEVLTLVSQQCEVHGIGPERAVLIGFSQGGTLALWTALQMQPAIGGLCLLGTNGLGGNAGQLAPTSKGVQGLPVLQCHGVSDGVCSVEAAQSCAENLETMGGKVDFRQHDGVGHAVPDVMLAEVAEWLAEQLPDTAK